MARDLQIFAPEQQWRKQVASALGSGPLEHDATEGFLYVPAGSGAPTGTPVAVAGFAPLYVDSVGHKLYFYAAGAWRDAGP